MAVSRTGASLKRAFGPCKGSAGCLGSTAGGGRYLQAGRARTGSPQGTAIIKGEYGSTCVSKGCQGGGWTPLCQRERAPERKIEKKRVRKRKPRKGEGAKEGAPSRARCLSPPEETQPRSGKSQSDRGAQPRSAPSLMGEAPTTCFFAPCSPS